VTGLAGLVAFLVVTGIVLWAVGIPAAREADQRAAAEREADQADAVVRKSTYEQHFRTRTPEELTAQLGDSFDNRPPWQPRVSARRVTVGNRIRWAYALADYPVPGYSWALSTTAQEATP
jgi:hypothetical protein